MNKGFHVLYDWRNFRIETTLRRNIERLYFSHSEFNRIDIERSNQKFYNHCWNIHQEHYCEECQKPLHNYSATFVSHILSRSNYPEYALDVRNHNILCGKHHKQWESPENKEMVIYFMNRLIIKTIKKY